MPRYISGQAGSGTLPDGEYPFEVIGATLKVSKNGNEMIELVLQFPEGVRVWDNLTFIKSAFWKIDQFMESIGELILPEEEVDVNPSDLIGRKGKASLSTDTFEGRDRNKIGSYIKA
jgi:hypothetical protein